MSWILIANRTGARLVDKQGSNLTLLETIVHEAGRARNRDLKSDRHGRSFDRVGGGRHALETSEAPHEHDARTFARALADRLHSEHMNHRFERLVLVAEPHFLGYLREALDAASARCVVASVTKDLSEVPLHELAGHLPELPPAVA